MANADYIPSYGEGYNDGYEDAKTQCASILRDFIEYQQELIDRTGKSYVTDGMKIIINALEYCLKEEEKHLSDIPIQTHRSKH